MRPPLVVAIDMSNGWLESTHRHQRVGQALRTSGNLPISPRMPRFAPSNRPKRKARHAAGLLDACEGEYYFRLLSVVTTRPTTPAPSKPSVRGSGTEVGGRAHAGALRAKNQAAASSFDVLDITHLATVFPAPSETEDVASGANRERAEPTSACEDWRPPAPPRQRS